MDTEIVVAAARSHTRAAAARSPGYVLRPIRPDERERLCRLWSRLSPRTIYRRFMSLRRQLSPAEVDALVHVDYRDRYAVVAQAGDEVIGVGRFHRAAGADAEVAVLVEDAWQHRGVGRALLAHLTVAAVARGINTFSGTLLGENRAIIDLLAATYGDVSFQLEWGDYAMRANLASFRRPAA